MDHTLEKRVNVVHCRVAWPQWLKVDTPNLKRSARLCFITSRRWREGPRKYFFNELSRVRLRDPTDGRHSTVVTSALHEKIHTSYNFTNRRTCHTQQKQNVEALGWVETLSAFLHLKSSKNTLRFCPLLWQLRTQPLINSLLVIDKTDARLFLKTQHRPYTVWVFTQEDAFSSNTINIAECIEVLCAYKN